MSTTQVSKRVTVGVLAILLALVALGNPAHAVATNFSMNINFSPFGGQFVVTYYLYAPGQSPYSFFVAGPAVQPFTSGAGLNAFIVAPATAKAANGTALNFQGWAAQQGTLCTAVSCNLPTNSPIVTTNSTYYLTTQTGSWNLEAIYSTGPPGSLGAGCPDPLNLGWTGRVAGCTFGVSNGYWALVIIAVVAVFGSLGYSGRLRR